MASWEGVPEAALDNLTRLFVVLEALVAGYRLEAMSIRCWTELQKELGISPCVVNGILADAGLPVACEVDTGSAVMMRLLPPDGRSLWVAAEEHLHPPGAAVGGSSRYSLSRRPP